MIELEVHTCNMFAVSYLGIWFIHFISVTIYILYAFNQIYSALKSKFVSSSDANPS